MTTAIFSGLGLAVFPRAFGWLAGPGASRPTARQWTRYQGLGFMLLGSAFILAAGARSGVLLRLSKVPTAEFRPCTRRPRV